MTIFQNDYLAGRRYLVTGASSGIGKAVAGSIAASGGRVIAAGRDPERLHDMLGGLAGTGHVTVQATLTDADATADWIKALVAEHGAMDGVFHAAGIELIRPVRLTKQAQLNDVMASSLFAAFGIARAMSQKGGMVDGGSIVFMSSVAGAAGQVGMTAYSAAKAGIDGLVRSLACELATRRIRVNAIAAGAVRTAMHERLVKGGGADAVADYERTHLLGFGDPADIANAGLFLLGDAGRWVTGTTMVIDGGYLCK
jgi:NAD(P)-dependent dehydrogenase (short-subunit alcohol dehydrogenase family)